MVKQRRVMDWLQITGSIGLIASLILVALQLRDANLIASAQMFSASVDTVIAVNLAQLGETPHESMGRVLYEPDTATVQDYYVADRVYDALFRALVRIHVLEDLGLYGSESVTPAGFIQVHYQAFASPYGVSWLDQTLALATASGNGDVPIFRSLAMIRDLAHARPAAPRLADRQQRARAIIERLSDLNNPADAEHVNER